MQDITVLGQIKIDCEETGAGVNSAGITDDEGLERMEGKVDIVIRKKQIDANNEIYYIPKQAQNLNNT